MAEDLRQRYAEALAEQFTWPSYRHRLPAIHERWADSPTAAPCLATLTSQYMGSFYVDEDGHPGMRRTTCAEVADAVMAVRDEELQEWRERAEKAEAAVVRARTLAEDLKAEAEQGVKSANIDSLRAAWKGSGRAAGLLLAALDDTAGTEETEHGG